MSAIVYIIEFGVDRDGKREFVVEVGQFPTVEAAETFMRLGLGHSAGSLFDLAARDDRLSASDTGLAFNEWQAIVVGATIVPYDNVEGDTLGPKRHYDVNGVASDDGHVVGIVNAHPESATGWQAVAERLREAGHHSLADQAIIEAVAQAMVPRP